MKNLLYTLSILFLISSCSSISKLIEKGKYDRAFALAVKKLSQKKHKKTKYVKGLETAFARLNKRDLKEASRIIAQKDSPEWNRVFNLYDQISDRQEILEPLLPLVSKDGYRAQFKFIPSAYLISAHVQEMEIAFRKMNTRDLKRVTNIIAASSSKNWKDIFHIYERIDRRQSAINDLPKIVTKDGYEANFDYLDKGYLTLEHVKGIENAFKKLNRIDLNLVTNLIEQDNPKYWDQILGIYKGINERQDILASKLPIRSKEGYKATFQFIKTGTLEKEASRKAAEYLYSNALGYLKKAKRGDKKEAIHAYNTFNKIDKYFSNYKDSDRLIDEAYELGQTRILIQFKNNSASLLPRRFKDNVLDFSIRKMNTQWKKFYNKIDNTKDYDIIATYVINYVDAPPEREIVNHITETKEVLDGWDYVLDRKGNVLKDSLGNDIKEDRYKTIHAEVAHVIMEKSIGIDGAFIIKNIKSDHVLSSKPMTAEAVFDEHFSTFRGNRNALSNETKRKLRNGPIHFPSDEELLLATSIDLKAEVIRELRRIFRNYN